MSNWMPLLLFFVGFIFAVTSVPPNDFGEMEIIKYLLFILLFFAGVGFGHDRKVWQFIKKHNLKVLTIPLGIVIGSLLGAATASFILPDVNLTEALAVGGGLGYYSLSSILITEIHGPKLGAIALVSNVSRELLTLWLAPFLAKRIHKISPVASGGATSMDTTLPVIIRYSGKEYGMIAVINGFILTFSVPFIVLLLL